MSFRLGLGHIALDFAATLGARAAAPVERLPRTTELAAWLQTSGAVPDLPAEMAVTEVQLREARKLREAIHSLIVASLDSTLPSPADIAFVNAWAQRPTGLPQLTSTLALEVDTDRAAEGALADIARQAIELVTGDDIGRVRRCEGCLLLFLDRSRPGRRRWCSMDRCGNRSKTARYRAKNI
jgi:predicted RNA-binding Zn ribbon-like protein